METVALTLTPDEAAMLIRGYIDGMPGGKTSTHQTLTTKLERLRYEAPRARGITITGTMAHGKEAARG